MRGVSRACCPAKPVADHAVSSAHTRSCHRQRRSCACNDVTAGCVSCRNGHLKRKVQTAALESYKRQRHSKSSPAEEAVPSGACLACQLGRPATAGQPAAVRLAMQLRSTCRRVTEARAQAPLQPSDAVSSMVSCHRWTLLRPPVSKAHLLPWHTATTCHWPPCSPAEGSPCTLQQLLPEPALCCRLVPAAGPPAAGHSQPRPAGRLRSQAQHTALPPSPCSGRAPDVQPGAPARTRQLGSYHARALGDSHGRAAAG